MSDKDRGKRMIEEMVLEEVIESLTTITDRAVTEKGADGFPYVEGSPDFIVGFDGKPLGIELAAITNAEGAEEYFEEIKRIPSKKHDSYHRRGMFRYPIALLFHSNTVPLFDIKEMLRVFAEDYNFKEFGFTKMWSADLSENLLHSRSSASPSRYVLHETK
jgi:hypothetical protein